LQLLFIGHALAVLTAGLVISGFGITCVFVHEDLDRRRRMAPLDPAAASRASAPRGA
jgi:hypothetical protein